MAWGKALLGGSDTKNTKLLAQVFPNKFYQPDSPKKLPRRLVKWFQTLQGDGTYMVKVPGLKVFLISHGVLSAFRPLTCAAKQTKRDPKHGRCMVWFGRFAH